MKTNSKINIKKITIHEKNGTSLSKKSAFASELPFFNGNQEIFSIIPKQFPRKSTCKFCLYLSKKKWLILMNEVYYRRLKL